MLTRAVPKDIMMDALFVLIATVILLTALHTGDAGARGRPRPDDR